MARLILVRHGQSIWNLENRFTGWIDVPLSSKGEKEAKKAGKILSKIHFDKAFTSTLIRAQDTLFRILKENKHTPNYRVLHSSKKYESFTSQKEDKHLIEVEESEKLNERHYGDLQGLNKDSARKKFGEEQVHIWRRSFDIAPPHGESLKGTLKRVLPYFKSVIEPLLKKDKTILISAHGNSLRALVMYLENLSKDEVINLELVTGKPIVYELNKKLKIIKKT